MSLFSFLSRLFTAPAVPPIPAAASQAPAGHGAEPEAVAMIIEWEESGVFKPRPYLDPVGIPTQGYGSIWNWRVCPKARVTMADAPITEFDARDWLTNELGDVVHALATDVKVPLNRWQTAALQDFVYNVGTGAFSTSTLLRMINSGNLAGAADEFAKWNMAGGRVLQGLVNRRIAERAEFTKVASA